MIFASEYCVTASYRSASRSRRSAVASSVSRRTGGVVTLDVVIVLTSPFDRSWDLHLADAAYGRSLGDVGRQQLQRVLLACGFDGPPDRVAARMARGDRRLVAEGAVVALE